MDVSRLKQKVSEHGFTGEEIAAAVGIDPSTYYRKMSAAGESFTVAQVKKMAAVLHFTRTEANEIFLT